MVFEIKFMFKDEEDADSFLEWWMEIHRTEFPEWHGDPLERDDIVVKDHIGYEWLLDGSEVDPDPERTKKQAALWDEMKAREKLEAEKKRVDPSG